MLAASSNNSASGLYTEVNIDLMKTPYLHWTWRVDNILKGASEKTRAGDDYPARIYLIKDGGLLFWNTRALNYVWASQQPINSSWPSAFTHKSIMIAVQSGAEKLKTWQHQRRNVLEDIKNILGEDFTSIDAVAIMTDTDNSHSKAQAYYSDIYFSNN